MRWVHLLSSVIVATSFASAYAQPMLDKVIRNGKPDFRRVKLNGRNLVSRGGWVALGSIYADERGRGKLLLYETHLSSDECYYPRVTNSDLAELAKEPLIESLKFESAAITDLGLVYLRNLASLQELILCSHENDRLSVPIGDDGLKEIVQSHKNSLRRLVIDNCHVTDDGIAYLQDLKVLEDLTLSRLRIGPIALESVGRNASLRRLSIFNADLEDEHNLFSKESVSQLQGIEFLDVRENHGNVLDDCVMEAISNLPNLKTLCLGGRDVPEFDVSPLKSNTTLEELVLESETFSVEKALETLTEMRSLKRFHGFYPFPLDQKKLKLLREALPWLEVVD